MPASEGVSALSLNRLSVYLRCLRHLQAAGVQRTSSRELAERFLLSAHQIRKDLAQFGEFGIRGVGYQVDDLAARLTQLLGLDHHYRLVIVGMGNLGSALVRYVGFNQGAFSVVAGVDSDPRKIGRGLDGLTIRPVDELPAVVRETGAEIGVLTVPPEVAQGNYDALVEAGVRAVLSFAPTRLKPSSKVPIKSVDLRINLEEVAFMMRATDADG